MKRIRIAPETEPLANLPETTNVKIRGLDPQLEEFHRGDNPYSRESDELSPLDYLDQ